MGLSGYLADRQDLTLQAILSNGVAICRRYVIHYRDRRAATEDNATHLPHMKRGAQLTFVLSALFFCFFVFGITDFGQGFLRGQIPPNATHRQLDDIYMGAGLAPWVYGLAPSVLLASIGAGLLSWYRLKQR